MSLQQAIRDLDHAAEQERIEPDSTLEIWVRAQREVLTALYQQEEDRKAQIRDLIDHARATAEARAREAQAITRRVEVQQNDLETKTVASLTKAVAEKLKDVLVIRERRWNRRDRNISWFGAAAFGLVLVIGGYSWRAVQDRDATTALRQCYDAAMQDKATGRLFCQLDLIRP